MAELPFVEKFRLEGLDDLAGNSNIRALKAFVKTGQFPLAMVFYGGFGTGKTTAARALVRDYYVQNGLFLPSATFREIRSGAKTAAGYEGLFPPVLYVDATLTRDIDFIKDHVQMFMKTVSPKGLKKFVVIDEADRLSRDAQGALRSLLEKYPNTVTVYTTNNLRAIDEAIVSRAAGAVFEFMKPSVEDVVQYLKRLAGREYAEVSDEKLRQIAVESESLREAVGKLGTEVAIYRAEHAKAPMEKEEEVVDEVEGLGKSALKELEEL